MRQMRYALVIAVGWHVVFLWMLSLWPHQSRPKERTRLPVVVNSLGSDRFSSPLPVRARKLPSEPQASPLTADGMAEERAQSAMRSPGPRAGDGSLKDVLSWGNPRPTYPLEAEERGWEGVVELEIEWGSEGQSRNVRVLSSSGYPLLDRSAVATARTWKAPAPHFGRRLRVPVAYTLSP